MGLSLADQVTFAEGGRIAIKIIEWIIFSISMSHVIIGTCLY